MSVGHSEHNRLSLIDDLIEYSDDGQCTICSNALIRHRYKCTLAPVGSKIQLSQTGISCSKFDLCRTCMPDD